MNINEIEFRRGAIRPGDCLSDAWNKIGQDYWLYFGIMIVASIIFIAAGMIPIVSILLSPIVAGPLTAGVVSVFIAKADGEKKDFGAMFDGFKRFLPAFIIGLVLAIPGIILQVYQTITTIANLIALFGGKAGPEVFQTEQYPPVLIGIYVLLVLWGLTIGILLYFAYYLVMDYNLDAFDAMKLSARAVLGNLGGIIVLFLLQTALMFAGILAFCIGIFFIIPVIALTSAEAYRQVFPRAGGPLIDHMPPSPADYGGAFGQTR